MPLFGNAFSPKRGAPRKATSLSNLNLDASEKQTEMGLEVSPVKLRLNPHEMIFADGMWIEENSESGTNQKEMVKIRKENQQLKDENNLLKIKVELLLDMLSERTAEIHLQENEIEHLKKAAKRR